MFKCSPHLTGHIRHLSITARYEILSLVSAINLSRLRIIRISSGEDGVADEATFGLIPDIISESVRHVHLSDFYSLSYTTLTRILEKPRALEGLHFYKCTTSEIEPSDPLPLLISPKHHLTYLSFSSSASIAQWLVRPGFPLDFSNLVCAEISRSSNATVAAILEGVRETLKSLTVAGEDFDPTIVTFKYWESGSGAGKIPPDPPDGPATP
ncbi:hypothetical protein B0H17DRAFT_1220839 [Mycena rosella]|uniref:Uncharacterized protein n=1 Tax=Mycena rosella TaxID=1033263 RepID=A0AAD7B7V8_MYCRO|nr:hypothetical protein B0H17DRAFT_1220839 [Mycena rosella]